MADTPGNQPTRPPPRATPAMVAKRSQALAELHGMGGLKEAIPDPLAWQKELREDVKLPGRD